MVRAAVRRSPAGRRTRRDRRRRSRGRGTRRRGWARWCGPRPPAPGGRRCRPAPLQGGQIEVLLQYLSIGLEDDGEGGVAPGRRQQAGGPPALHPQRGAMPRAAAGEQEGAGRRLAEARREDGTAPGLVHYQALHFVGLEDEFHGVGGSSASGKRRMMPSSDHTASGSRPCRSRSRREAARAQGACRRAPKGRAAPGASRPSRRGTSR